MSSAAELGPPRWRGQAGRLEVWYATFTDPASGDGFWLHAERVAPSDGAPAEIHGFAAVFPADQKPDYQRFGPTPVDRASPSTGADWLSSADMTLGNGSWRGAAGSIEWDLVWQDESPPLFTFPRWAWEREILPGAQVVLAPSACFAGTVRADGRSWRLAAAPGALSRIYGHGNAARWGWLHADLGGGDVLEIVAGAPRAPLLRGLGLRPFVQLRIDGRDWPRDPLIASLAFRAQIDRDSFRVQGSWRGKRLDAVVELAPDRSVQVGYRDPDGAAAICTNSERASARIELFESGRRRRWDLEDRAHAEIGARPDA